MMVLLVLLVVVALLCVHLSCAHDASGSVALVALWAPRGEQGGAQTGREAAWAWAVDSRTRSFNSFRRSSTGRLSSGRQKQLLTITS